MKRVSKTAIVILTTLFGVALSSIALAGIYNAGAITSIAVGSGGEVYIRWDGLPDPGPCGENNHWVMIPSNAPDTMKSLALSLYFSGKSAQIRTDGCNGAYELVTQLYSPKGG
jgi:hypothetical protein